MNVLPFQIDRNGFLCEHQRLAAVWGDGGQHRRDLLKRSEDWAAAH